MLFRSAILVVAFGLMTYVHGGCNRVRPRLCPEGMEQDEALSVAGQTLVCRSRNGDRVRWVKLYPGGGLQESCAYESGKAEGPYTSWHDNGKLYIEGQYHDGTKVGEWTQYDQNGAVVAKGEYRDGRFVAGAPVAIPANCEKNQP